MRAGVRLLFAVAVTVAVAFASYGAAATVIFSSANDPDVRCDTDGVEITGWSLSPALGEVEAVEVTAIDPSCVGAELYVQALQDGSPLADGSLVVASSHTGGNIATVSFTALGGSSAPVAVSAVDVTGVSVLMHRGSEPATGPSDLPCELLGMSIESWGVDLVSSIVSSISVAGINPDCIGSDLVLVVYEDGDVIADGRVLLTAGNTGSDVLTIAFTTPGAGNAASPEEASVITGVEFYVEGEVEDEVPFGPTDETITEPEAVPPTTGSNLTAQVQGTQIIPPSGETAEQPELVNEILGIRTVPSTGSGGLLSGNGQEAAPVFAATIAGLVAGVLGFTGLRRTRRQ